MTQHLGKGRAAKARRQASAKARAAASQASMAAHLERLAAKERRDDELELTTAP